ncbi:hypothetical protein D0844_09455 [Bordetella avium]|nr:hypothetical protein D0432_10620 [Bordetella avium]RIQ54103.1 hypothetical protein D0844_09455 [Bordetella avium]RIQ58744.1 hypothetical protein D0841_09430 [Bordetella avium]RIQ62506.1 hypothetical protein D0840_10940 [Bordetella avium]RIQ63626.1 hypothetical protein D0842_08400 [Bordetella avium]
MTMTPDQRAAFRDWAHIAAAVTVPVIVAILGWVFQADWKEREIQRDYLKLATEILAAKDVPPALCSWATDIVRVTSPVPFLVADPEQLRSRAGESGAQHLQDALQHLMGAQ